MTVNGRARRVGDRPFEDRAIDLKILVSQAQMKMADTSRPVRNDYLVTTNRGLLLRVSRGVTTETVPVVAPAGTVALL
jgi:hypothetical protein